jgi:glycosyltransferase involved in cell wall biosynthesis
MRIGVVTASYPRTEGEHAGNFVAAHVTALRAAGHDVDVVGAHTIESPLFYGAGAPDELERGGLGAYLAAGRFSLQLTREVARRVHEWDLIIAHWLAPSAMAAVTATTHISSLRGRLPGLAGHRPPNPGERAIPILAIAHGGDVHTLRRLRLLAPTLYALRARGVQLAFVSEELRNIARAAAPGLAHWLDGALVQPMGIDLSRFAPRESRESGLKAESKPYDGEVESNGAHEGKTIVVVARLVPIKGVDVALNAMRLLRTPARLVIAGDGPERERLEQLARSARRSIHFLGTVDTARVRALLEEADCVVIPSRVLPNGRTEGTPMIALEALAAGAPVIASAVGGLRELPSITRVRPEDPHALAAAIDRVLAAVPAAHASNAFDLAMFDWSYVSERLLDHAIAT